MDTSETTKDKKIFKLFPWKLWAKILLALWILNFAYGVSSPILDYFGYELTVSPNELGDSFGIANSIFSGVAFVGLMIAIRLQSKQLALQRDDLKLQRKDIQLQIAEQKASTLQLQGQKEQLIEQVKSLNRQNFENTFFQIVNLYNENIRVLKQKNKGEPLYMGRSCFRYFYRRLKDFYTDEELNTADPSQKFLIEIENAMFNCYEKHESKIAHNFRTLYSALNFVDFSEVENKKVYTNLIRSQLSSFELLLLFYNCLTPRGNEKFKPLIEKYGLFQHLPTHKLIRSEHKDLYANSAYE